MGLIITPDRFSGIETGSLILPVVQNDKVLRLEKRLVQTKGETVLGANPNRYKLTLFGNEKTKDYASINGAVLSQDELKLLMQQGVIL